MSLVGTVFLFSVPNNAHAQRLGRVLMDEAHSISTIYRLTYCDASCTAHKEIKQAYAKAISLAGSSTNAIIDQITKTVEVIVPDPTTGDPDPVTVLIELIPIVGSANLFDLNILVQVEEDTNDDDGDGDSNSDETDQAFGSGGYSSPPPQN